MPWNPEHYNVKKKEVMKILEDNKITNVGKNTPYSKEEPTHSEEMQDKLEPIENYGDFRDEIADVKK